MNVGSATYKPLTVSHLTSGQSRSKNLATERRQGL